MRVRVCVHGVRTVVVPSAEWPCRRGAHLQLCPSTVTSLNSHPSPLPFNPTLQAASLTGRRPRRSGVLSFSTCCSRAQRGGRRRRRWWWGWMRWQGSRCRGGRGGAWEADCCVPCEPRQETRGLHQALSRAALLLASPSQLLPLGNHVGIPTTGKTHLLRKLPCPCPSTAPGITLTHTQGSEGHLSDEALEKLLQRDTPTAKAAAAAPATAADTAAAAAATQAPRNRDWGGDSDSGHAASGGEGGSAGQTRKRSGESSDGEGSQRDKTKKGTTPSTATPGPSQPPQPPPALPPSRLLSADACAPLIALMREHNAVKDPDAGKVRPPGSKL